MKKFLIILTLLLLTFWLIGMPALVGQYVRTWVPEWLADIEATDDSHFEPGWFRSDLEISPGNDVHARLKARHMPPPGLTWLRVDGELTTPHSTQPSRIRGQLDFNGRVRLVTRGREVNLGQEPIFRTQGLDIHFDQHPRGQSRLQAELTGLDWSDSAGNRLEFVDALLTLDWRSLGEDQVGLEFSARFNRPDQSTLELLVRAAPLDVIAFSQLIEGIRQLSGAPPESMEQRMAFLTLIGAWQDLRQHGLEIELDQLRIGPDSEFSGQWHTATDHPSIQGRGRTEDLINLLAPIIGLIRTEAPDQANRQAREWIAALVQERVLIPENGQFRLHFQSGQDFRTIPED